MKWVKHLQPDKIAAHTLIYVNHFTVFQKKKKKKEMQATMHSQNSYVHVVAVVD